MSDLISRQAVMDCFKKWQPYMATRLWDFEQELSQLPSVNPQEPSGETVSLEAFKQVMWERDIAIGQLKELGYELGQKIEPCDDAISRQAVLGLIADFDLSMEQVVKGICTLPLVNPQEPKTGHWIPVSERLPEKNVWVLVTVVQGSGWYVEIMRIDKYKGMFTDNIDYYDSVIAWMPLPAPYEPQESEDKE